MAVGITANSYSDLEQTYAYNIKAGETLYTWGSYEGLDTRILGQSLSAVDSMSIGIGGRSVVGKFVAFAELGYSFLDTKDVERVRDEVVYTTLVHNHASEFRPIPVNPTGPYDQDSYETSYDISNGMLGRIGIGYKYKDFTLSMSYKVQYVDERIELWDEGQRAKGLGYWRETNTRNLSAFEIGLQYEF
jgi:hypothetical protein